MSTLGQMAYEARVPDLADLPRPTPWAELADWERRLWDDTAAAVLAHACTTPRVWRAGKPEPGREVRAVLDRDGDVWTRHPASGLWRCHADARQHWGTIVAVCGPLVEVTLPEPVTE